MENENYPRRLKPVYLVSSCLVGLATRYDGAVKTSKACRNALEGAVWIPVCPEQLGGLPTPRMSADLTGGNGEQILAGKARVLARDGADVTGQFISGAKQVLFLAEQLEVDGVFLKSGSPSCGAGKILGVTAALLMSRGILVKEF